MAADCSSGEAPREGLDAAPGVQGVAVGADELEAGGDLAALVPRLEGEAGGLLDEGDPLRSGGAAGGELEDVPDGRPRGGEGRRGRGHGPVLSEVRAAAAGCGASSARRAHTASSQHKDAYE